jgi:hypothetical protein
MVDKEIFNDPLTIFSQKGPTSRSKSVIKKNELRIGHKKQIDHIEQHVETGEPEIQPILAEEQVVGIIYKCICGKISEIHFDFDK